MGLHINYRPTNIDKFVGNDPEINKLISVLERKEDKPHTFLFHGPRGCGKTTLARISSEMVGASEQDIYEIDVTTNRGIDNAKEIKEALLFKPLYGEAKAFILDEVHQGTSAYFNALLKPLEEPPNHVYFFLCTTEPQKLLKTVKSRCMDFRVDPLKEDELLRLLEDIADAEKCDISDKYLHSIVNKSEGIPREALIMLDSVLDVDESKIEQALKSIKTQEAQIKDLCQALLKQKSWTKITSILKGVKEDPETVRWSVLGYMASVLMNDSKAKGTAALIINEFSEPFFNNGKAGLVAACYNSNL